MELNEKLKNLRLCNKMTQDAVAKKIGTTKQAICRYENGDRSPNVEVLQKYSSLFHTRIDLLLDNNFAINLFEDFGTPTPNAVLCLLHTGNYSRVGLFEGTGYKLSEIAEKLIEAPEKIPMHERIDIAKILNISPSLFDYRAYIYEDINELYLQVKPYDRLTFCKKHGIPRSFLYDFDEYLQLLDQRNISSMELSLTHRETAVMIAYRTHPSEQPIIDKILDVPSTSEEIVVYNAAYFGDKSSEGFVAMPADEWKRLKNTPVTDQDLS